MTRRLFLFSIALAAFLALVVTAMNPARVEIELAFIRFGAPVGLALVVAFTIGMLAGLIWRSYWVAELLGERGRLRRALRLAEAQARDAAGKSDGVTK